MKNTQGLFIGILLLGLIGVLYVLFWPRQHAPAEMAHQQEVAYWDLPTGSRIAYTHLQATAELQQPYPIVYLHGGPGGFIA